MTTITDADIRAFGPAPEQAAPGAGRRAQALLYEA
jgi:hypothetical protein